MAAVDPTPTRDKVRLALLLATGATATHALLRAAEIFRLFTATGFVGPGRPPSPQDFCVLAAIGTLSTGLFVLVGCSVVFNDFYRG